MGGPTYDIPADNPYMDMECLITLDIERTQSGENSVNGATIQTWDIVKEAEKPVQSINV